MGVLTKDEIIKKINKGLIKIDPLTMNNIGPGSIDLTLGEQFRFFKDKKKVIVEEDTDYTLLTKPKSGKVTIKPGEFILGVTEENVRLPENVCGFLSGRSRFARLGIIVHATASFIQPGINNKQVLEIYNMSDKPLVLKPGLKICQLTLIETVGKAVYKGIYEKQKTV
jgi:dCTP deaminase